MTEIIRRLTRVTCQNISSSLTTARTTTMAYALGIRNAKPKTIHSDAYYRSGALKPKPETTAFGPGRVVMVVIPGLLLGAAISKNVANFLEENDLFVPDDDDDDD